MLSDSGRALLTPGLPGLGSEILAAALPAVRGPKGVPRIALHADLLVEKTSLGLGETCHVVLKDGRRQYKGLVTVSKRFLPH